MQDLPPVVLGEGTGDAPPSVSLLKASGCCWRWGGQSPEVYCGEGQHGPGEGGRAPPPSAQHPPGKLAPKPLPCPGELRPPPPPALPLRRRWLCWEPCCSADRPPPPEKRGTSWGERGTFPSQHRRHQRGDSVTPRGCIHGGGQLCQEVPGGAQRRPLLLAEDETLVVGRHVHLQTQRWGSGGPRQCGALPARGPQHPPSSPGTARWSRPAAAAAPCPAGPRRDCCGVRPMDISLLRSSKQHPHLPGVPRVRGGVPPAATLGLV